MCLKSDWTLAGLILICKLTSIARTSMPGAWPGIYEGVYDLHAKENLHVSALFSWAQNQSQVLASDIINAAFNGILSTFTTDESPNHTVLDNLCCQNYQYGTSSARTSATMRKRESYIQSYILDKSTISSSQRLRYTAQQFLSICRLHATGLCLQIQWY